MFIPFRALRLPRVLLTAVLLAAAASCAPDPEQERLKRTTQATYDAETGRLKRLTFDADKNGRIDTWTYMDGTRILRSEIDRDEDGKIDRWEMHGPDGSLEKVGLSRANSGKVDAWAYSGADGTIERVEEDADGDGKPEKWETYAGGRMASAAFDENGDGRPDRRLLYGPGGALVAIESEPDAGGRFTKKVDVK